ncbi:hypothetical protein EAX62_03740 [Tessaracoccus antarcticus]|uniref:Uncharacterized protein n=1 Tax=Tessaracoccus antarcticus TaxID=2479848 RepID=A0A3M0GWL6_9ACTN|nr:hypothetical protein EAX62_03740 [Tessaracoccus antarcticus]
MTVGSSVGSTMTSSDGSGVGSDGTVVATLGCGSASAERQDITPQTKPARKMRTTTMTAMATTLPAMDFFGGSP